MHNAKRSKKSSAWRLARLYAARLLMWIIMTARL